MSALARLPTKYKVLLGFTLLILLIVIVAAATGSAGRNDEFQPQNEFQLSDWIPITIGSLNLSITRAVLYLAIAAVLTCVAMTWIARRMAAKPNRVQTAVEALYVFMRDDLTQGNMNREMAAKWFPFVATLFLFIWISNLLGYIPLPTSHEKFSLFGAKIPAFAIYAATANISVTLVLTLVVWFAYHIQGIAKQGPIAYFKSWVPAGVTGFAVGPLFVIEIISHFVRIISLSVRLFANILAGHLLILFMAGGLVVLLGIAAIGVLTLPVAILFFLFEVVLIATLQAFIFAVLAAIYLGSAVAADH